MHRQASERAVPSDPVQHDPRIVFAICSPVAGEPPLNGEKMCSVVPALRRLAASDETIPAPSAAIDTKRGSSKRGRTAAEVSVNLQRFARSGPAATTSATEDLCGLYLLRSLTLLRRTTQVPARAVRLVRSPEGVADGSGSLTWRGPATREPSAAPVAFRGHFGCAMRRVRREEPAQAIRLKSARVEEWSVSGSNR